MKKGEISIEFVVLAALALIFLIVVALLISGKIGIFNKTLGACESAGGSCVDSSECNAEGGEISGFNCKDTNDVCCMGACALSGGECTDSDESCGATKEQAWLLGCASSSEICCVGVSA
jgi:hypothetical protein